ncbi:serine/threonine protein kinase [Deinococcus sp.]|uniref:serine/threonine protein kinase n=1 Tax=Deinococcus sp. TaxID=47478 RepID=UPI0025BCA276|nr:serine/threonine protein kinase [Deinococcus sp.]
MDCPICGAKVPGGALACPVCGTPLNMQTLPIGTLLHGKYRIDKVLGQGGFGITYAATQTQLGFKVAVKEMFPGGTLRQGQTVHPPTGLSAQNWQQAKADFTAEAKVLARFSHPDIVRVLDLFEEGGTAYMVMELLQGESLQSRIDRLGALPPAEVQQIAVRVTEALKEVHAASLLHRDIKPDNILLEASGRIVLIDFGSARDYHSGQTVRHTRLVTPGYAPLEQYGNSAKFGPYTDIYALGATLHHALTGQMPPAATDLMNGTPMPALPATTLPGLRAAITQAMAVRVSDRPQDADAMLRLLRAVPGTATPTAPLPPQPAARPMPRPAPTPQPVPAPQPTAPPQSAPGSRGTAARPVQNRRQGCLPVWPLLVVAALFGFQFLKQAGHTATPPAEQSATDADNPDTSTPDTSSPESATPPADSASTSTPEIPAAPGGTAPTTVPAPTPAPVPQPTVSFAVTAPGQNAEVPSGPLTLRGDGQPGDELQVFQDGAVLGSVKVPDDGHWAFKVTDPAAGDHQYIFNAPDGTELGHLSLTVLAPAAPDPAPTATTSTDTTATDTTLTDTGPTDTEVQNFVEQYLSAEMQTDPAASMQMYADQVDYLDRGTQPKAVIEQDKRAFFRRWPTHRYSLDSVPQTISSSGNTREVRFDYTYELTRPTKKLSGKAYSVLKLVKIGGQLYITSEQGKLYPEQQTSVTVPAEQDPQASAAAATSAPTFSKWYFTTCQDVQTGDVNAALQLGRLQQCQLNIETVPNGAKPVSATFTYELEYQEGGATQKFAIDAPDQWPSTGEPVTTFREQGDSLIFTLPLTVKDRPDRRYTSINATGELTFDNGSRKKVYEKLPIQQP